MNRNRRLSLAVLLAVMLLAAASAVTWRSVAAQPGNGPRAGLERPGNPAGEAAPLPDEPVPGGPGFAMHSSVAFRPSSPATDWAYGSRQLYNPGAAPGTYYSSPSLPNGATITKIVVYYYDNCPGADLIVDLLACGQAGEICDGMAAAGSWDAVGGYGYGEDSTVSLPLVDQQSCAYIVQVQLPEGCGSNLRFVSVRIDYVFEASLPLVARH